ncbi:MAG: MraY family glycosyltransferase [Cytophagales bacterium]|nr:MraY family glycosyltransferase [Cytophagales bacterium]
MTLYYTIAFVVSFFFSAYLIRIIIKVADKYKLYDKPEERKIHSHSISALGGIGLYFSILLGLFAARLIDPNQHFPPYFFFILFGMTVLFLNGLGDDLFGFSAYQKFFIQFIICFFFIDPQGVVQVYFQELFDSYWISHIFISIVLVAIINGFNLLDGIDGLAGSVGIFTAFVFFVLNYVHGNFPLAILSLSLAGALAGFLIFNFSPARIFMGDSGSLLVGFVIALLTISTPYKEDAKSILHSNIQVVNIILGLISFPLFEVFRLFFSRLISGASPFVGDRNHLHHVLVDSGYSHKQTVFFLVFLIFSLVAVSCIVTTINWVVLSIFNFLLYYSFFFLMSQRLAFTKQNNSPSK